MSEETPTTETPEAANERPFSLLASEKFGDRFKGEAPVEEPEEVEEEVVAEEPEEASEEPETAEETQEAEGTEETVSSLRELIEANEWDPEWVQSLKIPVKVNGSEDEKPLAELVKSYQIRQATEAELSEAKEKSKAALEEINQQKTEIAQSLQILQTIVQDEEAAIEKALKSTDWAKLREDDPAEYSARKVEIEERREALQAKKQKAVEAFKKVDETTRQQRDEQLRQYVQTERTELLKKIPEWRDPDKAQAEQNKLSEYLIGQGYTKEEIARAYDHRLVVGLRKAMLWDEMQSKSQVAKKKVVKVPKVLKPGAPKPKEQVTREKLDGLRSRLNKSGSIEDALKLLRAQRA